MLCKSDASMIKPTIRKATQDDVVAMVELAEQRRVQYQNYQPRFWRKAVDSREKHAPFLSKLVQDERVVALVSELEGSVNGFLIATLVPAPPVYDTGGMTCSIDDFSGLQMVSIGSKAARHSSTKRCER